MCDLTKRAQLRRFCSDMLRRRHQPRMSSLFFLSEKIHEPGILQTFGAALWIVDYVLQGALNGVDRLYFHQGTISNCVSTLLLIASVSC